MIVFKINTKDYSNRVIAGSYSVNSEDVFKSYQDLNGIEHHEKIRDRIKGSFDMYFETIEQYEAFNHDLEAAKLPDLSYANIAICDNKNNKVKVINAFITFQLTRNRNGQWYDMYERFKVNIQER